MTSKHTEQKCSQDFKTIKDLVSHVAKEHHETEEELELKNHSTPKSNKEEKESSFVLSESMLDEFL